MRSVSLVEKLELEFKGTVFQNALCFTDIDDDDVNELCICNLDGELNVFKGIESSKPCYKISNIGPVVILCGGCVVKGGKNVLCAIDTEGWVRLITASKSHVKIPVDDSKVHVDNEAEVGGARWTNDSKDLHVLHKGKISPNSKVALLQDIDDDGSLELVIGYTDRFVRIYKWQVSDSPTVDSNCQKKGDYPEQRKGTLSFTLSLSKDSKVVNPSPKVESNVATQMFKKTEKNDYDGCFVLYKQFSLLAQLGSIAICKTIEGLNQVIVSQPNGGYCILGVYGQGGSHSEIEESLSQVGSPANQQIETYPTFYPIVSRSFSRSSSHIDTQVIGGIKRNHEQSGVLGLCTQDGYFMVLENNMECHTNPVKNSSEHRWFSMSKLDATRNGNDEIVLCSMNGMTYVIDKHRDIVSFNFNDSVAAFLAGDYGLSKNENSLSLCYVTLSGKIFIYYNFSITAMKVKCVHSALIEKIQEREDLRYILDMLKLPDGSIDHQKIQELVKKLWSEK